MGLFTRFPGRLAATAALATAVGLALASPAAAATITLNQSNITAANFRQDCTGPFADLSEDMDGWHFAYNGQPPSQLHSITLIFNTGSDNVAVGPISSTNASQPDSNDGWYGYLDRVGTPARATQAYVFTPAGWTLVTGTATTTPPTATGEFDLIHTCARKPTPTTTTKKPSGPPNTGGGGSQTGSSVAAGVGALALAGMAGAGLVLARRRRRES